jgi:hypothetical protein
MAYSDDISIVRIGIVTSVDNDRLRARVKFPDLGYTSGELYVLKNQPFIPGYDEKPQRTEYTGPSGSGYEMFGRHKHDLTIKPWMPKVNEKVLVLYIPIWNADGFILGGIE